MSRFEIHDVFVTVAEHIQRLFGTGWTEGVGDRILSILQPKMTASYAKLPTVLAVGRVPSHTVLRAHLKHNSYPDPDKTQLAYGFDFHVNTKMLQEIERRYMEGDQKHLKNRNGNFGMDVVAEMVGGLDVYREGLKHVPRGSMDLLGEDIPEAIYRKLEMVLNSFARLLLDHNSLILSGRAKKVFDLTGSVTLPEFRKQIAECKRSRGTKNVDEGGKVMASILFDPNPKACCVRAPDSDDPPAKPGCNYWTSPAPHRTRLALNSSFYMDKIKLAEYQRYMGPESASKNKNWHIYAKMLVQHAAGGEEAFFRICLERRKAKMNLNILDAPIRDAIIGTVRSNHRL